MKKIVLLMLVMVTSLLIISSCQYKFIVEPAVVPPNPDDTISFSLDIIPIWNSAENCVACHNGTTQDPDLRPDAAYGELNSMGLIDTQNPEQSIIYTHPNPDTDSHSWKKYSNVEAAKVLLWIEQGAKNN
ncbi:MAG: hypothetical protein GXO88_06875 [Chlorobi bacterium]|nr:hypothetical protein [Chlorobiota bacterium]